MERVQVVISGVVQGVGFRYATSCEARRLGLSGWVRNLPDGRVELSAEGERDRLEQLLVWCRQGPPHAKVQSVDVVERGPVGDPGPSPFEVR